MATSRVKSCLLSTNGLTATERKVLAERAAAYGTGDATQDYINAVKDTIAELRAVRERIVVAIASAKPAKTKQVFSLSDGVVSVPVPAVPKAAPQPTPEEVKARKKANSERVEVEAAIDTVETSKSDKEVIGAIAWLLETLLHADTNIKKAGADKLIIDFFDTTGVDSMLREGIERFAKTEGTLSMVNKNGVVSPVMKIILRANMLDKLRKARGVTFESLPEEYATPSLVPSPEELAREANAAAREQEDAEARAEADEDKKFILDPAAKLVALIRGLNASTTRLEKKAQQRKINRLKELWQAVSDEGTEDTEVVPGVPLSEYFKDGDPITNTMDGGRFTVGKQKITASVREQVESDLRESAKPKKMEADDLRLESSFEDWNTFGTADSKKGRFFRDDGQPLTDKVPPGRIHVMVANFLGKLRLKPNIHVYKNQADFKLRNPAAYARAVLDRPQGDFDTTSAVGYSFGDGEVAIFTDRVATEKMLKFVLAHETLGHFGFRAIMPEADLRAALYMVYDSSARIQNAVDQAVASRGMSKSEAIEEYLADFAGVLDTNVLARFWETVKNFLNKLGFKFEDDMARYMVGQARMYVRNGKVGGQFINFVKMAQRYTEIETIQDPDGAGRYSQSGAHVDEMNHLAAERSALRQEKREEVLQTMRNFGTDRMDQWKRVVGDLRTMNYAARENFGYRRLYEILRDTVHTAAKLRSKYNNMMHTILQPAAEVGSTALGKGATKAQIDVTNAMLNITSRVKMHKHTDAELAKVGQLYVFEGGRPVLVRETLAKLQEMGRLTVDEFRNGFTYVEMVPREMDNAERARLQAERDVEVGKAVDEAVKKKIVAEYAKKISADVYMHPVERKYDPKKGKTDTLTAESLEWQMYLEVRNTMDESATDLLHANFVAAESEREGVLRSVAKFLGRNPTEKDTKFIQQVQEKYLTLRFENSKVTKDGYVTVSYASVEKANTFIKEFNQAVLGRDTDLNAKVQAYFDTAQADDIFNGIQALKENSNIPREGDDRFRMQQAIQNLALFEMSGKDAEKLAKKSIAGGYVPFGRQGGWQVRINAVDPDTGRVYKVGELYRQQLFYAQVENPSEAQTIAEEVNAVLAEAKDGFRMQVLDDGNKWTMKTVKLVAQAETARKTVSATSEANLNEVIGTLTRFSVSINPQERENLIIGLTNQNNRARTRLARAGTPGEDKDTLKYVSQHLEATASTVARKHNRHRLDRLFDPEDGDSTRLWKGDKVEYTRREAAWKAAQNNPRLSAEQRQAIKRDFDDYHYVFVTKRSQEQANRYLDMGQRLVGFLESQTDVEFNDPIVGDGEVESRLRLFTTFAQMGLSPATAILNYLSLGSNVMPALAGYNEKNGFGGGFGWAGASAELTNSLRQTSNHNQSEIAYWDDLLAPGNEAKLKAAGFTQLEAMFMQKEVASGSMQAALTNALLGTARGKITSGLAQRTAKAWMGLFNYSEQAARRSTGLAAFRLAFAREMAVNNNSTDPAVIQKAFDAADKFAVDMIDNTLGEYAMFNRPAMFRGGVGQFIFMYKMFPVNTIQMLWNLPRKEQVLALGILLFFTGLKGLPFAEDMMDILDTIAQALGLGPRGLWKGSAEKSFASFIEDVAPGMTPLAMRGFANHFTPANVSDRMSMGNIVPGTGIFLAGADVGRELIEVGGPVASFTQGMIASTAQTARFAMDPSTAGATDILRKSPVTMMRAAGDIMVYHNTGAIVSQKGSVVSRDLHAGTFLVRALGFYPSSAVAENDVIRMNKRLMDYRKDVSAMYRSKYIVARLSNDSDAVSDVFAQVDHWNERTRGTGMEIPNFRQSANRSFREANRSATERYLRTVPVGARRETQRTIDMLMTEDEQAN